MCDYIKEINFEFVNYDGISSEEENEALNYFFQKNKSKFKKLINKLNHEYEERDFIHVLTLYEILLNKKDIKYLIEKTLKIYSLEFSNQEDVNFSKKIGIILANELKKFYKNEEILNKLNTLIIMFASINDELYISENNELILSYVIDAHKWLTANLELTSKEKTMINYVTLDLINVSNIYALPKDKTDEIFRYYFKLIWELRNFIDIKPAFSSLFKGINWSYFKNIKKKEDKDIIAYLVNLGVEESVAYELFEIYLSTKDEISDGNIGSIDKDDIPF